MPRLIHSVPKYRKHAASGQAFVELAGRRYYLGPHGTATSKRAYDARVAEWLSLGRQPTAAAPLTLVEVMAAYWRHVAAYYVKKNGEPTSEQAAIRSTLRVVKQFYGDLVAADFSARELKTVRLQMIDAGLARSTVNDNVGRIRRMFKWAASEQLVPASVLAELAVVDGLRRGRTHAKETEPVEPVDDAIVDTTLPHLPAVVADMVLLQRLTGARPHEITILRPVDVDRSGDVWIFTPATHKTEHRGKRRRIPIGPQGREILLCYLARDAGAYCFRPVDSEAKRRAARHEARRVPLSYGNRPGTNRAAKPKRTAGAYYSVDSYRRAIHRACDRAFPAPADVSADAAALAKWQHENRWSPNQLRHAAATEIRQKYGLEAAQVVLGHSAADVTQIYAERDERLAVEVARSIG
jgi:integrase